MQSMAVKKDDIVERKAFTATFKLNMFYKLKIFISVWLWRKLPDNLIQILLKCSFNQSHFMAQRRKKIWHLHLYWMPSREASCFIFLL